MNLTSEERAILAHVVLDVDAHVSRVLASPKHGEAAIRAKIDRWRDEYIYQKSVVGYKDRATRQAEEDAALAAKSAEWVAAQAALQAQKQVDATLVLATLPTREAKDAMARLLGVSP